MISKFKKWLGPKEDGNCTNPELLDEIQLIEGSFNPMEAADVLLSLIAYKIKFHNVQLLNSEHDESSRIQSEKRIAELKEAKNRVTRLIMEARNSGKSLKICSKIRVSAQKD